MSHLLYLMFRCDRECDGKFREFGNFVGTKHTLRKLTNKRPICKQNVQGTIKPPTLPSPTPTIAPCRSSPPSPPQAATSERSQNASAPRRRATPINSLLLLLHVLHNAHRIASCSCPRHRTRASLLSAPAPRQSRDRRRGAAAASSRGRNRPARRCHQPCP